MAARAAATLAGNALSYTVLRAPFDGVVVEGERIMAVVPCSDVSGVALRDLGGGRRRYRRLKP